MFVFAQDMEIGNWVKILVVSTTRRVQTPIYNREDKTWNKGFAILFLKYTPKLYAYPWKKKNTQIQSLYPQISGLEIWSRKCFRPHPTSTPHSHFQPPSKNLSA
jgi:hypothetical protein